MLAFTPTPLESWPLDPKGEFTMGLFSMLRWKINPGSVVCWFCATVVPLALVQPVATPQIGPPPRPPLSRADHRLQTFCSEKFPNCLEATAAVQLAKPLQYPVPDSAASKKG